ncbi:MAG TPA: hypothetical protein VGP43_00890 [Chitinophagaceae bacterium]|nr:hypothetical protein [Chitinophagaceae bacterium]
MKYIFAVILIFLVYQQSYSQQKYSLHASQWQLEIFGPGSLFSLNYDARFAKKEKGLGFRFGIGGSPLGIFGESCNRGSLISLPVGLNYLIGKNRHYAEFGGGYSLILISATKRGCLGFKGSFFSDDTAPYGYILAGYRYQPINKSGVTYRAFISPLFQPGFNVKLWGGASIGYRF